MTAAVVIEAQNNAISHFARLFLSQLPNYEELDWPAHVKQLPYLKFRERER